MDILPGVGVASARVGESRATVEDRLGPSVHTGTHSRAAYETTPLLIVTYSDDDVVELVEVAHGGGNTDEAYLDGVQLTWRFLGDVVADLAARGYRYEPEEIGYRFEAGFTLFSMGSRTARDLDPAASPDDPREVCEGVGLAPLSYLAGQ